MLQHEDRGWHRLPEEEFGTDCIEMDNVEASGDTNVPEHGATVSITEPALSLLRTPSVVSIFSTVSLDLSHPHSLKHGGVGLIQTFIIIVKSFVGVGILTMPRAFYNGGYIFAPVMMVLIGIYSLVCTTLLVQCRQKIHGPCGFSDLGKMACGPRLAWLITISIVLSQCGFCAGYFIFISHNVSQALESLGFQIPWLTEGWLVCFQLVFTIPLALIRHIKYFALPALVAEICIFGGVFCIGVYAVWVIQSPAWHASPPRFEAFNAQSFGVFIGMAISAFEGVAVVLPIHDAMRRPSHFTALLAGNTALMITTYAAFAGVGYMAFGSGVHDVIILNLPRHSLLSAGIQLAYCLAVVFTFPLQLFPVLQIVEKGHTRGVTTVNLIRSIIVVLISLVAIVSTQHLEHLLSLIGALCCAPLAFIFPSVIHFHLVASSTWERLLDVVFAVVGVAIMAFVLTTSVWAWIAAAS
jgi:proton-coupled amino acid transporter